MSVSRTCGVAAGAVGIIAHRGASFDAPENTLAAVRLGWAQGADAVEVDVMRTADGCVVVFHDETTLRLAGVDHVVGRTPRAVLNTLDVGSWKGAAFAGERIASLEAVIATIPPGRVLVVEIKDGPLTVDAMRPVVERSGRAEQLVFIAFEREAVTEARRVFTQSRCYWLLDQAEGLAGRITEAAQAGLHGINLCCDIVTAQAVGQAAHAGLEVLTWTVNDPQQARRLAALGVCAITTDRPGWLRQQLEQP